MENYSVRTGLLDQQSEYEIVNNDGRFDLQRVTTTLLNKLKLSTTGSGNEAHIPSYHFEGPNSSMLYKSEKNLLD